MSYSSDTAADMTNSTNKLYDIAIVGGGLAGVLVAQRFLHSPYSVLWIQGSKNTSPPLALLHPITGRSFNNADKKFAQFDQAKKVVLHWQNKYPALVQSQKIVRVIDQQVGMQRLIKSYRQYKPPGVQALAMETIHPLLTSPDQSPGPALVYDGGYSIHLAQVLSHQKQTLLVGHNHHKTQQEVSHILPQTDYTLLRTQGSEYKARYTVLCVGSAIAQLVPKVSVRIERGLLEKRRCGLSLSAALRDHPALSANGHLVIDTGEKTDKTLFYVGSAYGGSSCNDKFLTDKITNITNRFAGYTKVLAHSQISERWFGLRTATDGQKPVCGPVAVPSYGSNSNRVWALAGLGSLGLLKGPSLATKLVSDVLEEYQNTEQNRTA